MWSSRRCQAAGVIVMVWLSIFPRVLAAQTLTIESLAGEDWYGLYLNGQKAGYSKNSVTIEGDGSVVVVDDARFKTNMVGVHQDMQISSQRVYEKDGPLRSIDYKVVDPASLKEFHAVVEGEELVMTSSVGGVTNELRFPRPKESWKDMLKQAALVHEGAQVGDEVRFNLFEPMYQKEISGPARIVGIENRMFDGVLTKVFKIQSVLEDLKLESVSYVTEKGTVLEDVTAGIITMRLEPEELAKDVHYSNDVIVSNAAMVKTRILNPRTRESLTLHLRGPLKEGHIYNDERQSVVEEGDHYVFTGKLISLKGFTAEKVPMVLPPPPVKTWSPLEKLADSVGEAITKQIDEKPVEAQVVEEDIGQWLKPTLFVQSDDARMVGKAKEIIGESKDSFEISSKLCSWVHDHVRTSFSAQLTNSLEVLDRLEGDCTEYSILFIGLARAAGLPAREVAGVIYMDGTEPGFYFHQWAKVWIGKWIDVDPTFNQPLADATHIKLVEGDFFEQNRLIPIIGQISVDVLNGGQ